MSSVMLTLFQRFGIHFEIVYGALEPCSDNEHGSHDGLLPFFNDNVLLHVYNHIILNKPKIDRMMEVQKYPQKLIKAMENKSHRYTCYHTNAMPQVQAGT